MDTLLAIELPFRISTADGSLLNRSSKFGSQLSQGVAHVEVRSKDLFDIKAIVI